MRMRPLNTANCQAVSQAKVAYAIQGGLAPNPHTPDGLPTTPAWVCAMLEEAGATLLALPQTGYSTRLRSGGLDWVREASAVLAPGSGPAPLRPAIPSPTAIDRMDRALAWISLIPDGMFVLRRVAGARALIHPMTGRHLFPWRRLGTALGADHKAVQRWHAQAMIRISAALNAPDDACVQRARR